MSDEGEIWKRIVIVIFLKKNKLYLRYNFTISLNFFYVTQYFLLSGFKSFVEMSSRRLSRRMDSTVKYAMDDIISKFDYFYFVSGNQWMKNFSGIFKSLINKKQNDIQATKPVLVKSVLKTACLLLPNEILFKIFGYLDIPEI